MTANPRGGEAAQPVQTDGLGAAPANLRSGRGASIQLGYAHASLIDTLRPDIAYPGRKVRPARAVVTELYAEPCDCPDDHLEVWARIADIHTYPQDEMP
jgi:hypothetical protein